MYLNEKSMSKINSAFCVLAFIFMSCFEIHAQDRLYPNEFPLKMSHYLTALLNMHVI